MANVNYIQKTVGSSVETRYYEDTAGRNLMAAEQDQSLIAVKDYAVGELFWYNDLLYKTKVEITTGDTITLTTDAENTTISAEMVALYGEFTEIKEKKASIDLLNDTVGWTGKNLLQITSGITSTEITGITFTFTRNADGEVTEIDVNGTATSVTTIELLSNPFAVKGGTILTGCPSGGGSSTYMLRYSDGSWHNDEGSGISIANDTTITSMQIRINNGYVANHVKFYPMIRDASINNADYEPYHESVDVCKVGNELFKDTIGFSGKNLNTSESTFTFVKSSARTKNFYLPSTSSNVRRFAVSFDVSGIANYTGTTALTLKFGANEEHTISTSFGNNHFEEVFNCGGGVESLYAFIPNTEADTATITISNLMIRKADIADPTYEPYHPTVKQTLRDAEVIEGKNLLDLISTTKDWTTKASNGVTCTNNHDGTFGLSGTATDSNINNWLYGGYNTGVALFILKAGNYAISDVMIFTPSGDRIGPTVYIGEETKTFTLEVDTNVGGIRCASATNGASYNGKTLKPILCDADEEDYSFEPYYIPLKDAMLPRAEQRVLGAKNLLPLSLAGIKSLNSARTWSGNECTHNGITFTVNTDANGNVTSISESGTATGFAFLRLARVSSFNGSYLLNKGISANKTVYIQNETTGVKIAESTGGDTLVNLTPTNDVVNCIVGMSQGQTGTDTFYPMLRLASDTDDTYAPYAMTNKQLTDMMAVQESAVTDIIDDATVENNVMGNYLYKSGNVVELRLSLRSVTANAWTTLARIPEGYRPKGTTNPVTVYDTRASQYFNIAPGGSIQCHGALSNGGFDIHTTWITN